tara:strand:- start:121 stop:1407 length:1287 start_codon:yes stop_codon:yes gene_type:complete
MNIFFIIIFFIFIYSCKPLIDYNIVGGKTIKENREKTSNVSSDHDQDENKADGTIILDVKQEGYNLEVNNNVNVVLPNINKYKYLSDSFLNSLEIAVFDLNNKSITYNINQYESAQDLEYFFSQDGNSNKIFIGPLTSEETKVAKNYCNKNIIVFSFASDRSLAGDCIYLFNFFIEDDLRAIFDFLDKDSKVALLYPNNNYGNYVNLVINDIAKNSEATLIYKLSYEEDLSNIRNTIKNLGKYEFRKDELNRQIEILKQRNDEISLASIKKLEKFETIGELDFTHLIISDGNIRILELAPLLPFYDIDPDRVKFVGTGLWDEKSFFEEPSLQGAFFPGIEISLREKFIKEYIKLYYMPPPRTATVMYDVVTLTNYLYNNFNSISEMNNFLESENIFFGLDGKFSIKNNIVKRELSILKINDGKANLIN